MKKILYLLLFTSILIFSSCNKTEPEINQPSEKINISEVEDNKKVQEEVEKQNEIDFNSNLKDYEKKWLTYFENKYPSSKIYHIKTKTFNCEDCYELFYKKDREILKVKVLNNELNQESVITDLLVNIENEKVCNLFQGDWNTCPKLCPTDEELCITQCGAPICEFDENKIIYKTQGEICGGLDEGDCEFGLSCYYKNTNETYGTCISK